LANIFPVEALNNTDLIPALLLVKEKFIIIKRKNYYWIATLTSMNRSRIAMPISTKGLQ